MFACMFVTYLRSVLSSQQIAETSFVLEVKYCPVWQLPQAGKGNTLINRIAFSVLQPMYHIVKNKWLLHIVKKQWLLHIVNKWPHHIVKNKWLHHIAKNRGYIVYYRNKRPVLSITNIQFIVFFTCLRILWLSIEILLKNSSAFKGLLTSSKL